MSDNKLSHATNNGKHAILIIAHAQQELLETLCELIDHERIEIFIHIDKKWKSFDEAHLRERVKFSTLKILDTRIDVQWSSHTQIWCELALLKEAAKTPHDYYHLLSGADLPLKTPDKILNFFDENAGKEFVQFVQQNRVDERILNRFRHYHFFQQILGRKINSFPLRLIERALLIAQKTLKINRVRKETRVFSKGAQWFSITQDLANSVLSEEKWIRKTFWATNCCDEIFLQTLIVNSDFKNNLFHQTFDDSCESFMRLIDWKRGGPYTFKSSDYDELINSPMLFARKFDLNQDAEIIFKLRDFLKTTRERESRGNGE